jgi:broad specificity phosphatase PhoE
MEETTTIYLVRHGETAANVTNTLQGQSDVPLNANGLKQAALAAERLKNKHFDFILSSDLSRAAVTAKTIAGERPVETFPILREWDLGEWVGLTWDEIGEKFPEELAAFRAGDPDAVISGGESRRQFNDRAAKILQWLTESYPGKELLCVSHGGVIRSIFRVIMGAEAAKHVRTDNTCVCVIRYFYKTCQWQIITWNDISHLEGWNLSTGW